MGAQNKNTRILLGIILSLSVRSVADNNQWGVLLETSLATTVCDLNRSDILEYNEMDKCSICGGGHITNVIDSTIENSIQDNALWALIILWMTGMGDFTLYCIFFIVTI